MHDSIYIGGSEEAKIIQDGEARIEVILGAGEGEWLERSMRERDGVLGIVYIFI